MGIPWLQLIDFDTVEPVNLACQGYLESDLGRPKVQATVDLAQQLNHQLEVHTLNERFRRSTQIGNVLFCGVDKIETRQHIWEAVRNKVAFFADGRMALRRSASWWPPIRPAASTTRRPFCRRRSLYRRCTSRSTIFSANIAAGLMLEQFTRYLRGMPVDPDLQLNLLSSELTVTG